MRVFVFSTVISVLLLSSCGINGPKDEETIESHDSLLPKNTAQLNERIREDPDNPELYYERAKAHLQNKDLNAARTDMENAIKLDSTKSDYYLALADIYLGSNKTSGTKTALEKCIALEPENKDALMKLAELFFYVKKYDQSLDYINRTLKIDQYDSKAYFMKGMNYLEMEDTAKAISSMITAVEQDQQYYAAYMRIGLLYAAQKNPLAIDYYNNALRIQPKSIEAIYDKGKLFQDIQDWKSAQAEYNKLLGIDPMYKFAHYNLGAIELLTTQKHGEALTHFDKAIESDPQYVEAYYARGTCYEALGNKKKAIEDYSIALEIRSDYEPAIQSINALTGNK